MDAAQGLQLILAQYLMQNIEKLPAVIPQQRVGCFLTLSCLCAKLTSPVIIEEIQKLRLLLVSKAIPETHQLSGCIPRFKLEKMYNPQLCPKR